MFAESHANALIYLPETESSGITSLVIIVVQARETDGPGRAIAFRVQQSLSLSSFSRPFIMVAEGRSFPLRTARFGIAECPRVLASRAHVRVARARELSLRPEREEISETTRSQKHATCFGKHARIETTVGRQLCDARLISRS